MAARAAEWQSGTEHARGSAETYACVVTDRSAKYGLDGASRTWVTTACNDLSRAINTLEAHHGDEQPATDAAMARFMVTFDAAPESLPGRGLVLSHARSIEERAFTLRNQRRAVLDRLLALRAPIVDVLFEAHSLLGEDATFAAHVEAHRTTAAPKSGAELDLEMPDRLRILEKTLRWSRQQTYGYAIAALAPCYALSHALAHPTREASDLSRALAEAREHLRTFIYGGF